MARIVTNIEENCATIIKDLAIKNKRSVSAQVAIMLEELIKKDYQNDSL